MKARVSFFFLRFPLCSFFRAAFCYTTFSLLHCLPEVWFPSSVSLLSNTNTHTHTHTQKDGEVNEKGLNNARGRINKQAHKQTKSKVTREVLLCFNLCHNALLCLCSYFFFFLHFFVYQPLCFSLFLFVLERW